MMPKKMLDIPSFQMMSSLTGEKLAEARSLTGEFELKDLLIHLETLEPGARASALHAHTAKEEMFIVLEGTPTLVNACGKTLLQPGDCVGVKPADKIFHMILNNSPTRAVYLTIATNPADDSVLYA
jgi:uncharacterized cupin superfamily protein